MGAECPNSHGRQNVVANIGSPDKDIIKGDDVISQKLACGCVVGGPDYEEFQKHVLDIRNTEKLAIQKEREKTRKALGAAFRAYNAEKEKSS